MQSKNEQQIPIVDLSADERTIVDSIRKACLDKGFFFVINHGVPEKLVQNMFDQSRHLFQLSDDDKESLRPSTGFEDRGFAPLESETLDPTLQTKGDTKESFSFGKELEPDEEPREFYSRNVWPNETKSPEFRYTCLQYFEQLSMLGHRLVKLIALSLHLDQDFFEQFFTDPVRLVRLLKYSAEVSDVDQGVFGAGAHTDYGMITILATDSCKGLQVWDICSEKWITPTPPNVIGEAFIINLGDMLQRWTNDQYKSTLHRVVNLKGVERYSIPFFFEPNFDTLVECIPSCISKECPPKYSPVRSGEYLLSKYAETYSVKDPQSL